MPSRLHAPGRGDFALGLLLAAWCAALSGCRPAERPPTLPPGAAAGAEIQHDDPAIRLDLIRLPPGFRIDVWAAGVPRARSLARSPAGVVYVGSRGADLLRALVDTDGDGRADRLHVIGAGLNHPNGVAWRDGSLYVAEIHRILRYDDIDARLSDPPVPVVLHDGYPRDGHHGWKFIAFDPQGRLHVPVGAPCNICAPDDPYAAITRLAADGSDHEVVARGVRNTVGFDWHPETGELWFTDNGRDWLGDDAPPDELNRAGRDGLHFGYPHCHGRAIVDPEFGRPGGCEGFTPPARELGAHVAALGMRFYTGDSFPPPYRGQIFIAEHGSWNRSEKVGYRVTLVRLSGSEVVGYEPFAEGWLQGQEPWGRPVDVLVMDDGSLLVSDDHAGAIYRIWHEST